MVTAQTQENIERNIEKNIERITNAESTSKMSGVTIINMMAPIKSQ